MPSTPGSRAWTAAPTTTSSSRSTSASCWRGCALDPSRPPAAAARAGSSSAAHARHAQPPRVRAARTTCSLTARRSMRCSSTSRGARESCQPARHRRARLGRIATIPCRTSSTCTSSACAASWIGGTRSRRSGRDAAKDINSSADGGRHDEPTVAAPPADRLVHAGAARHVVPRRSGHPARAGRRRPAPCRP